MAAISYVAAGKQGPIYVTQTVTKDYIVAGTAAPLYISDTVASGGVTGSPYYAYNQMMAA